MSMRVPDRVHVVPLGYERERVVLPAVEYKADKVVLVEHDEPPEDKPAYYPDLIRDLERAGIEVDRAVTDIFDLYAVLGTVAELITDHTEDEVYVNLSTGSKISAIGGMIACMVTRNAFNVTPFYVRAEGYSPEVDEDEQPVGYGMKAIAELPTYPIEGPTQVEIVMLQYIQEAGPVSKKDLIQRARVSTERFQRHSRENDIERDANPQMGEYRLLDTYILTPLENRECITISDVGRRKEVGITEEGKNTLRAFKYLLNMRSER